MFTNVFCLDVSFSLGFWNLSFSGICPLFSGGFFVPFSILTSMSFNSIILLVSAFSCLSMLSTEIRVRYLLLYSGIGSLFL